MVMVMKTKYGKWTIIPHNQKLKSGYVWCRCKCGTEKAVSKYHLRDGKSSSCGNCNNDLVGKQYGRLTVIKKLKPKKINGKNHTNVWKCECACGRKVKRVTSSLLRAPSTYSCSQACKFGYGTAALNRLFSTYKRSAKDRNIRFDLDLDQFATLTSSNCHYCSSTPQSIQKSTHNNGDYFYNGIDRIDPKRGYIKGNVVPCCKYCNSAKLDRTSEEFHEWINQLLRKPTWEPKCWGRVWHRFNDRHLNESLLEINKGWQCSIHWHENRWNCFVSIDATIGIEDFGESTKPPQIIKTTMVHPGESLIVRPKTWHRFFVIDSGRLVEIYWTTNGAECNIHDIIRHDIGGKRTIDSECLQAAELSHNNKRSSFSPQ